MQDTKNGEESDILWTMQQISTGPTGKPWYALRKLNSEGVQWGTTGYRYDIDRLCAEHGITPVILPSTTLQEFLHRPLSGAPQLPAQTKPVWRMTWELTT